MEDLFRLPVAKLFSNYIESNIFSYLPTYNKM